MTAVHRLMLVPATLAAVLLQAQEVIDPLEADRPDQTESPAIVPVGRMQLEFGWSCEAGEEQGTTHALPALLLKPGVTRWLELRVIAERSIHSSDDRRTTEWEAIEVGAKAALCAERGWRPRTSIIAHASFPGTARPPAPSNGAGGNMRFTCQHTLSSQLSLGYNLGAEWADGSITAAVHTVTLGVSAGKRWGFFGEAYGWSVPGGHPDHRVDAGATCRIGPDWLLDVSGGTSFDANGPWFIGAGCSFRIPVLAVR